MLDDVAMVPIWISEFRDKGAEAISVSRDGTPIKEDDLPALIDAQTKAYEAARVQGSNA